jgi:hypothetical protein
MGRAELRGFEWAGLKLAIETPSDGGWTGVPEDFIEVGPHREPDVEVSVDWRGASRSLPDAIPYSHEGSLFEAACSGSQCWVSVSDDGRLARFDANSGRVHIVVPAASRAFPLARPLDDLILIHRALGSGALTVRGTAAVRDGRALLLLGDATPEPPPPRTELWQGWLIVEPVQDGVRVQPLPSTMRSGPFDSTCGRALLDGLHVVDPMTSEEGAGTLDPESAAGEILRYAFAPLAASGTDRLVEAAMDVARRTSILRLCGVGSRFAWGTAGSLRPVVTQAGA